MIITTELAAPRMHLPQLFTHARGTISFSGGLPDLSVLPADQVSTIAQRLLKIGTRVVLQYSTPHISPRLVPAIADLAAREGMHVTAERLIPTSGSQLGLTIAAATLPGDVILTDSPTYPGALAAFHLSGRESVAVVCDAEGMVPEALQQAVRQQRAAGRRIAAVYCNPTFHNPTGATQSLHRREQIVEVCRREGVLIIEDNPYGLLSFTGQQWPSLKSLAPEDVVYLGTFSKIFAPGLRAGWIDAPQALVDDLRATSEVYTLSPSALSQAILADYHRHHGWDDLLHSYRTSYRERAGLMSDGLARALQGTSGGSQWSWDAPDGGFYLWLTHLGGADADVVAHEAAQAGVSVVPGSHFSPGGQHRSCLRLCYSYPAGDDITVGVERLAGVLGGVA